MYLATQDIKEIVSQILALQIKKNEFVWLILGENNMPNISLLIEALNRENIRFFGSIFPKLIFGDCLYDEGIAINVIPANAELFVIHNISQKKYSLPELDENHDFNSALIIVDGLSSNLSEFLNQVYDSLGNSIRCFGGGAGSLSLHQQPCLFTNNGFFQDAALLVFMNTYAQLGVRHGLKVIEGPFLVNNAGKNTIKELNWVNAFEIYQNIIERNTQKIINPENFFELSRNFPFGISKYGSEFLVRDLIKVDDEMALVCIGEVPENVTVAVMQGENKSLIKAARTAAEESLQVLSGDYQAKNFFVFDCITRNSDLEDDFKFELQAVNETVAQKHPNIIPFGALTLCEIASNSCGYIDFLNKTIVTALLYNLAQVSETN